MKIPKNSVIFKAVAIYLLIFIVCVSLRFVMQLYFEELLTDILFRVFLLLGFSAVIFFIDSVNWNLFRTDQFRCLDIAIIVIILLLCIINNVYIATGSSPWNYTLYTDYSILMVLLGLLINSIAEEVMYRGFLQTYINSTITYQQREIISRGNIIATVLMTITHFGFFTVMAFQYALPAVALVSIFSLAAGYLRDRLNNLTIPVCIHILWNFIHFFILVNFSFI